MKAIAAPRERSTDKAMAYAAGALVTLTFVLMQALSASARGAPDSFADLAERLSPAVVNITTSTMVAGRDLPALPRAPQGSPLEELSLIHI